MFDQFVKNARLEKNELEEQYGLKCLEHLKLQKSYEELDQRYSQAMLDIESCFL